MKKIFITVILSIYTIVLLANGGSISDGSFVRGNSSITLLKEKNIKLKSENLNLHIQGDYINVNVIYELENLGEAKRITYGFAVDYRDNSRHKFNWDNDYIKDFTIINNTHELQTYTKTEKNVRIEQCDYSMWDAPATIDTISRKWFISDLDFAQGETKKLVVTYRIKTNYADWGRQDYPSDTYYPASLSNRLFRYYLKPSGFWGDGTVDDFNLEISFDNIAKYSRFELSGIDSFNKTGNVYTFKANNFNLLENDYLKIDYNYSKWLSTQEAISFNNSKDLVKSIRCSSQHKQYPVSNLIDKDKNTAFVPLPTTNGNNWIEVEFNDSVKVYGVGMLNGYSKSKSTYFNNNVVTKLKVRVAFKNDVYEKIVSLERKSDNSDFSINFVGIEDLLWGDLQNQFYDSEWHYGAAVSLRIEILEYDKGTKFTDTCISELLIFGEKY